MDGWIDEWGCGLVGSQGTVKAGYGKRSEIELSIEGWISTGMSRAIGFHNSSSTGVDRKKSL